MKEKTKRILVIVVKWRHHANDLLCLVIKIVWIILTTQKNGKSEMIDTFSLMPFSVLAFFILLLLGGVYMTLGQLSRRCEFTPIPSRGSVFVYMIPSQNVMPARVTPAWVHSGSCTGARISLRYEISQRYHVNAKRPIVSEWNRSAGRLERVAHV